MKIIRNLLLNEDLEKFNKQIFDVGDWDGLIEENGPVLSTEEAEKYQDVCNSIPFFTLTKENVVLNENEKVFLDLQKEINGDETKGREVLNRIINW